MCRRQSLPLRTTRWPWLELPNSDCPHSRWVRGSNHLKINIRKYFHTEVAFRRTQNARGTFWVNGFQMFCDNLMIWRIEAVYYLLISEYCGNFIVYWITAVFKSPLSWRSCNHDWCMFVSIFFDNGIDWMYEADYLWIIVMGIKGMQMEWKRLVDSPIMEPSRWMSRD